MPLTTSMTTVCVNISSSRTPPKYQSIDLLVRRGREARPSFPQVAIALDGSSDGVELDQATISARLVRRSDSADVYRVRFAGWLSARLQIINGGAGICEQCHIDEKHEADEDRSDCAMTFRQHSQRCAQLLFHIERTALCSWCSMLVSNCRALATTLLV
jgi:hypothetical protein